MKKDMLINVLQPEECRIAILEDGILEELYVERTSQELYVGNIYKGRIVNIEPSIQAAFVDFGVGRNGFLHVSDVDPLYFRNRDGRARDNLIDLLDLPEVGPEDEIAEDELLYGDDDEEPLAEDDLEAEGEPNALDDEEEVIDATDSSDISSDFVEPIPLPPAMRPRPETLEAPEPPRPEPEPPPTPPMPSVSRRTLPLDPGQELPSLEEVTFTPKWKLAAARSEPVQPPAPPPPPAPPSPPASRDERPVDRAPSRPRRDPDRRGPRPRVDDEEPTREPRRGRGRAPERATEFEDEIEDSGNFPADDDFGPEDDMDADLHLDEEVDGNDRDDLEDDEPAETPRRRRHGQRPPRRGGPRRAPRPGFRAKPPIQEIFRRGQEVLVQVIKEGLGTKGPTLSTYISIPGRYLVLMPGLHRIGVSRKIEDEQQRRRLRGLLQELRPPQGLGFIIRTAGVDRSKRDLQRDLAYLTRLWRVIVRKLRGQKGPGLVYQESDIIIRTIRDVFSQEIETVRVDEENAFRHAHEFLQFVMPRFADRLHLDTGSEPLFHRYGIEQEIAKIQQRRLPLPGGGSLVIDQTEALVAIDVNSGNFRVDNDAEETAFRVNLVAAKEVARQLRLRDLGGVIVIDFIDMREERHRREVERTLREAVRRDRARTKTLRMSQFGIVEMTRQRIRPSLKRSSFEDCPCCKGTGQVKTTESMSIEVMRLLQLAAHRLSVARVQVRVTDNVAQYLLNRKRREIASLEDNGRLSITILSVPHAPPETLEITAFDGVGGEVKLLPTEPLPARPGRPGPRRPERGRAEE
jgi:ribonuclease E